MDQIADIGKLIRKVSSKHVRIERIYISRDLELKLTQFCYGKIPTDLDIGNTVWGVPIQTSRLLVDDEFRILGSDGNIYLPRSKKDE